MEILLRSQRVQAFLRGAFQVDRDTICQLHQAKKLIIFDAWDDLEVQLAAIMIAVTDNFRRVEKLFGNRHG